MTPYENPTLRERALLVATAQRQGLILIERLTPEEGGLPLPVLHEIPELTPARAPHAYTCPWGTFQYDPATRLFVFAPSLGQLPPAWENYGLTIPIQPVSATVEVAHRTVTIRTRAELLTLVDVPTAQDGDTLLNDINTLLAQARHPYVAWQVRWTGEAHTLWEGNVPMVQNQQVGAYLTGYALDREHVVYLGMTGYKTVLESIRATVQARRKKLLEVHTHFVFPLPDQYFQVWQGLDDFGYHHAALLARPALPGKWLPDDLDAYLLGFDGDAGNLPAQLAARLSEGLCIPILPEWGPALWEAGQRANLIRPLTYGGDCQAGYAISLPEATWTALVQHLLEENQIQLI